MNIGSQRLGCNFFLSLEIVTFRRGSDAAFLFVFGPGVCVCVLILDVGRAGCTLVFLR